MFYDRTEKAIYKSIQFRGSLTDLFRNTGATPEEDEPEAINFSEKFQKLQSGVLFYQNSTEINTQIKHYSVAGCSIPRVSDPIKYLYFCVAHTYAWNRIHYGNIVILTGKIEDWNENFVTRFVLQELMDNKFVKIVMLETDNDKAVNYAQIGRLFASSWMKDVLDENSLLFTTDTDVFPIDEWFFTKNLERVFEKSDIFSSMRLSPTAGNNYTYLGLSGICMRLKTWRSVVNFDDCENEKMLTAKIDLDPELCENHEHAKNMYIRDESGELVRANRDSDAGLTRRYDLLSCSPKCPIEWLAGGSSSTLNSTDIRDYISNVFGRAIADSESMKFTTQWFLDQYFASLLVAKYVSRNTKNNLLTALWRTNIANPGDTIENNPRLQRGKNWSMSDVIKTYDETAGRYVYKDSHMPGTVPFIPKEWWHTFGYFQHFYDENGLKKMTRFRNQFIINFHKSPNICVSDYDSFERWLVKAMKHADSEDVFVQNV